MDQANNEGLNDVVVVVEDDQNARETLVYMLSASSFKAVAASDGVDGLETIRRVRPKVAVIDLILPRYSGYELCKELRSDPDLNGLFLIVASGISEPKHRATAMLAGGNLYLLKPFDVEKFIAVIAGIVQRSVENDFDLVQPA